MLEGHSSDVLGNSQYWFRTKPVFDYKLLGQAKFLENVGFARNDKRIASNLVRLSPCKGGMRDSSADDYGLLRFVLHVKV